MLYRRAWRTRPDASSVASRRPPNPHMPPTAAVAARSKALLEPAAFEEHMTEALRLHSISDMPSEHARTQLMLGHYLRRHNQAGKARSQLTAALAIFDRLGAPDWANRTRSELQATEFGYRSLRRLTRNPHSPGASGCAGRCTRALQPRGRKSAFPQYEDDRIPPQQRVPQAGHQPPNPVSHSGRPASKPPSLSL